MLLFSTRSSMTFSSIVCLSLVIVVDLHNCKSRKAQWKSNGMRSMPDLGVGASSAILASECVPLYSCHH